jgi:hypothetical protein
MRIVLAGLTGFLVMAGAADLVNPGWSPVESMVSHYVHARAGWLITVALLSLAAASAALLRRAAGRAGRLGPALLGVWAACVLVGAVFPSDPPGSWDRPPTPSGLAHGVAALVAFVALPSAAVVLTRRWRRDPCWPRPVARLLSVAAALTVVSLLAFAVLFADVTDGPSLTFGPWESLVGLAERVMLCCYVGWLAVAAVGMHAARRPAAV